MVILTGILTKHHPTLIMDGAVFHEGDVYIYLAAFYQTTTTVIKRKFVVADKIFYRLLTP